MDAHEGEHPRIGAVDVIPFIPLGSSTMDEVIDLARASGSGSRRVSTCRSTSTPARLDAPTASAWPTFGAVNTRGSRRRSVSAAASRTSARHDSTRPPELSRSAPARSSSPTTSTSIPTTSISPSGSRVASASPAADCRRLQANGFEVREPERGHPLRAQVSMNLLDFEVTPLWLVWDVVRELAAEDGVRPAESELIGLAPQAVVRGDRRPRRGRSAASTNALAAAADYIRLRDSLADADPRASSRGRPRRRRRRKPGRRPRTVMSGGPFRVIEGGRTGEPTPGLLIVGANEVVTLAGGVRRGPLQGDVARLLAEDPAAPDAPVVAVWEGRIAAVGPRDAVEAELEADGLPLARFARRRRSRRIGDARPDRPAHPPALRGIPRGRAGPPPAGASYLDILAAGGGILSTVAATRAASESDAARPTAGAGSTRCSPTASPRSRRSPATASTSRPSSASSRSRYRLGREGPIDVVPTWLGAHAVPPEFRSRPDGVEAYVRHLLDEQLPGIAAHGRARFADVFCEEGVFSADQSRRILEAARAFGLLPRLHADELAPSGGAELAAELGAASADHLATPSLEGIAAMGAAADAGRPGGRDPAAGDHVVPDEGSPRARRGRSSRPASRSPSGPTSIPGPRRRRT